MSKVHIWCPRASDSAIKLRDSLRLRGIKAYKTPTRPNEKELKWFLSRIERGDIWLTWGASPKDLPFRLPEITILNQRASTDKKAQLLKLEAANIPVPSVYDTEQPNTIGRSRHHIGGSDLLAGTGRDYWTQKIKLNHEVRVHVFGGKSIHVGKKVLRGGFTLVLEEANHIYGLVAAHPWIRTYNAGWKIDYAFAPSIRESRRKLAIKAVQALGLDFGAVDIGVIKGEDMVVLEVNTAPGLDEGPSVEVYTRQIISLIEGG